jgi:hypothetical protein
MHEPAIARAQAGAVRLDRGRCQRAHLFGSRRGGLAHQALRIGGDAPGLQRALQDPAKQRVGLADRLNRSARRESV